MPRPPKVASPRTASPDRDPLQVALRLMETLEPGLQATEGRSPDLPGPAPSLAQELLFVQAVLARQGVVLEEASAAAWQDALGQLPLEVQSALSQWSLFQALPLRIQRASLLQIRDIIPLTSLELAALHEPLAEAGGRRALARRQKGQYHTALELARLVVRWSLEGLDEAWPVRDLRVLDPALGSGIFLIEAGAWLAEALARQEGVPEEEAWEVVVSQCLYGVELDGAALRVARQALLLVGLSKGRFPTLGDHLRQGDALVGCEPPSSSWEAGRSGLGLPPERAAAGRDQGEDFAGALEIDIPTLEKYCDYHTWTALHPGQSPVLPLQASPERLRTVSADSPLGGLLSQARREGYVHYGVHFAPVREGGFHAVVGNPPYLSELRGGSALFARLKAAPRSRPDYASRGDLFYHFLFQGSRLLRPGGRLGMVIPPYWRVRSAAGGLRRQLTDGFRERKHVDFGEFRLFSAARGHHSEVTVWERSGGGEAREAWRVSVREGDLGKVLARLLAGKAGEGVERVEATGPGEPSPDRAAVRADHGSSRQVCLAGEGAEGCRGPVFYLPEAQLSQGAVLPQATLNRAGQEKLGAGVARVGEGIFWLRPEELEALQLSEAEKAFAVPYLPAGCIQAFHLGPPQGFLLYLDAEASRQLKAQPRRFPRLRAHLERFAPAITSSRGPFGLHRPRERHWFEEGIRVYVVRKGAHMRAALVRDARFVDQGVNIIRVDDVANGLYLLGILHSSWAERWLRARKPQGGLLQADKDVLCAMPLPQVEAEEATRAGLRQVLIEEGGEGLWGMLQGGGQAGRGAWRVGIELLVEALSLEAAARSQVLEVQDRWNARPGRGGRFMAGEVEPGEKEQALRTCLDRLVNRLYGEPGPDDGKCGGAFPS